MLRCENILEEWSVNGHGSGLHGREENTGSTEAEDCSTRMVKVLLPFWQGLVMRIISGCLSDDVEVSAYLKTVQQVLVVCG